MKYRIYLEGKYITTDYPFEGAGSSAYLYAVTPNGQVLKTNAYGLGMEAPIVVPDAIVEYHSGWQDKDSIDIYDGDIVELNNEISNTVHALCKLGNAQRILNERQCDISGFYFFTGDRQTFPIIKNLVTTYEKGLK